MFAINYVICLVDFSLGYVSFLTNNSIWNYHNAVNRIVYHYSIIITKLNYILMKYSTSKFYRTFDHCLTLYGNTWIGEIVLWDHIMKTLVVVSVRFTMIDRSLFCFSACHTIPMVPLQITLYFAHICTLSKVRCGIKRMQSAFKSLNFKIFVSLLAITVLYFLFYKLQCSWCYFEHMRILLFSSVSNLCSTQW